MTIIAAILAILVVIVGETVPLFRKPSASARSPVALAGAEPVLRTGVDEYQEMSYAVTASGLTVNWLSNGAPVSTQVPSLPDGAKIIAVSQAAGDRFAIALSDGRVQIAQVKFSALFTKGARELKADVSLSKPMAGFGTNPVAVVAAAFTPAGPILVLPAPSGGLHIVRLREKRNLMGQTTTSEIRQEVAWSDAGATTALAVDSRGEHIFAGTERGELIEVEIEDADASPVVSHRQAANPDGAPITALEFLLGDRTLVVGDAQGRVSGWQILRREGRSQLVRNREFEPHTASVQAIAPSRRNKTFATADAHGRVAVRYGTTGATLLHLATGEPSAGLSIAPKSDGLIAGGVSGSLHPWTIVNPHPEVTWRSLFGKLWYEGYEKPEYVWQSTGGTDDFEAKFSLTPLIYGTLKGTFYALIFAIPIALLGALYASQFMHPSLKNIVKPVIEIMAALPSVVLGFIAGLWLAPVMEKYVPGLLLAPFVISACILVALFLWHRMPDLLLKRLRPGSEVLFLAPVILIGGWLSLHAGAWMEQALLAGDYRLWIHRALGLSFDQRNSMVVGFAMGFAVVPIIFTIAEDALASVPNHLKAGSLALGATPWQTAVRVVLPTASPGIFSAIMIGFGRAVGETMIVLMATGNTPVMNANVFSGFRALSANIAVELPEAPVGGTLYRILFLAAFLLFAMTFALNTVAELIRLRLRKRYRVL